MLPTEYVSVSGETLLRQIVLTVKALHASVVPRSVKDVQEKPFHNRSLAAGAYLNHSDGNYLDAGIIYRINTVYL